MKLLAAISFLIVTLAFSVSAFAGCNITVKFVNKTNKAITIDKVASKVRVKLPAGVPQPPWRMFMNSNVTVGKKKTVTKSYTLTLGCEPIRKFKFKAASGSNSWWETKTLVTTVDKKLTVKLKP